MKYIVDNLTNQNITGNLRIDGGITVTDGTYSIATYKALLTQTAAITSGDLADLLSTLNSQVSTNYFGTYADDGVGGLSLTIPAWLKRQFAEDNVLTFEVYAD